MNIESLEKMLAQGTDNPLLRFTLANLYLKEKRPERALAHIEKALEQNPRHSASWKSYGKVLASLDREMEAMEAYTRGIEIAEALGDVQAAKEMRVFLRKLRKNRNK
jgi:predicted Zn-dependent protease